MTLAEFEAHVAATERTTDGRLGGIDYCLMKLCAEAGEVAQLRAREILDGAVLPPVDSDLVLSRRARFALELGDVLWYLVEACRLLGVTPEQVMYLNYQKLKSRRVGGNDYTTRKDPPAEQRAAEAYLSAYELMKEED